MSSKEAESAPESAEDRFRKLYESGPAWETGSPQPVIQELFHRGKITGRVLDAGCGTGQNAIWLASRGCEVVAFDFIDAPLQIARERALRAGVKVHFHQRDALTLADWNETFDTILDSGLYHVFPDDIRPRYVQGLHHVLAPEGLLHLICFSDRQPGTAGPLRISASMLEKDFGNAWQILEMEECRYELRQIPDGPRHDGRGALAWRLMAKRLRSLVG